MQHRNRWVFLLAGCAIVVYALLRLLQAEYSALLTLFTAWVWFFFAYRPPQFRSRFAQRGMYALAILVAVVVIATSVYEFFA